MFADPAISACRFFDDEDEDSVVVKEEKIEDAEPLTPLQQWFSVLNAVSAIVQERRPQLTDLMSTLKYLQEAQKSLNSESPHPPPTPPPFAYAKSSSVVNATPLSQRRLLIRLKTAQSEVLACRATYCRLESQWLVGAHLYGDSLKLIQEATCLADAEVARSLNRGKSNLHLELDASIVETCIGHLQAHKRRYERAAENQKKMLEAKLENMPLLTGEALQRKLQHTKRRPPGTMSFRQRRAMQEEQLRDIELALETLYDLHIPDFEGSIQVANLVESSIL